MPDFRIFALRTNGNEVIVNVEHVAWVQAVYAVHGEDEHATLHMVDGSKIDLCDFHSRVAEMLLPPKDDDALARILEAKP